MTRSLKQLKKQLSPKVLNAARVKTKKMLAELNLNEQKEFDGPWMVNNGYTREMAIEAITSGYADLVAFGKPYIANSDLVERLKSNASLNQPDPATFYGGDAKGYTDYPRLR